MDSKRIKSDVYDYLKQQNRFIKLERDDKDKAVKMQDDLRKYIKQSHSKKFRESLADEELFEWLKKHYGEEVSNEGKCLVL